MGRWKRPERGPTASWSYNTKLGHREPIGVQIDDGYAYWGESGLIGLSFEDALYVLRDLRRMEKEIRQRAAAEREA